MVPKMNAFIWIDTDAETSAARIQKRGREGEGDIPLPYLQNLDRVHRNWLSQENTDGATIFRSQDVEEVRAFIHKLASS